MGKMVGIAEFKAKCERLLSQMEADGEPIQLTRRGKLVGVVSPPPSPEGAGKPLVSAFGLFKSDRYFFNAAPEEAAVDPAEWEANNPADLHRRP